MALIYLHGNDLDATTARRTNLLVLADLDVDVDEVLQEDGSLGVPLWINTQVRSYTKYSKSVAR